MGKERHKKNDTVSKAMPIFTNSLCLTYQKLITILSVGENKIGQVQVQGRDCGGTIFGVCDLERIEDKKLTPILAVQLIPLKQKGERIVVEMSELVSEKEKVLGGDDYEVK